MKSQSNDQQIILGDYNDIPAVMVNTLHIYSLPHPHSSSYPHQMLAYCLDKGVDKIYILDGSEMDALQPAILLFSEYGIDIQYFKNDF